MRYGVAMPLYPIPTYRVYRLYFTDLSKIMYRLALCLSVGCIIEIFQQGWITYVTSNSNAEC